MAMGRVMVNMEMGEIRFLVNNEEVAINVRQTMKHPANLRVVSVINCIDDLGGCSIGTLMNFKNLRYPHHTVMLNQLLHGRKPMGLLVKME